MATQFLKRAGTQIRFYVSGSFSPADSGTDWSEGTPTDVVLTLAGIANTNGRQSDKADLGENWAARHILLGCIDFTGETPTGDNPTVDYYWAPSTSSTTGEGNVAGNSGSDGNAPNGALGSITLDEFLLWCIPIGQLPCHDGSVVQNGYVGELYAPTRYGQLIVVNSAGDAFEADDVEMHQILQPVEDYAP